jgi:hypothetical protein
MKKIIFILIGFIGFTMNLDAQCSVSVKDSLLANYDYFLTAINPTGVAPFTYTWTIKDGNGAPVPYTVNTAGDSVLIDAFTVQNNYGCLIYQLCVTDDASCNTCIADTAILNVPFPCYSQFTSTITGVNQVSITLSSNIPPFIMLSQMITWTDGDGQSQSVPYMGPGTTINYVPASPSTSDKFLCCVINNTVNGGCLSCDSIQYTNNSLKVKTIEQKNIQIAPNPATSIVTIKSPSAINRIELFNVLGQKINSESDINNTSATLQISSLTQGVYIIRIYTVSGMVEKRIVKE